MATPKESNSGILEFLLAPAVGPELSSFLMEPLYAWFQDQADEKDELVGTVNDPAEQQRIFYKSMGWEPPPAIVGPWPAQQQQNQWGDITGTLAPQQNQWGDITGTSVSIPGRVPWASVDNRVPARFKTIDLTPLLDRSEFSAVRDADVDPADIKFLTKRHPGRSALIRAGFDAGAEEVSEGQWLLDLINSLTTTGGGGGRAPYPGIDRRTVEEAVENQMILLTGRINTGLVASIVDDVMLDDKRRYEGAAVDPNMTLLERVRNTDEYRKIHAGRPDSAPENTWVSSQRNAFLQGGGTMAQSEQRAIDLATVGAAPSTESAGIFEASRSNIVPQFFEKLAKAADFAASRVV